MVLCSPRNRKWPAVTSGETSGEGPPGVSGCVSVYVCGSCSVNVGVAV